MNEIIIGFQALLSIIFTAIASFIWMLGGRDIKQLYEWHLDFNYMKMNRIYGRLIAPVFFTSCLLLIAIWADTFKVWDFALYGMMIGISHMGHGGDTLGVKLRRRFINGFIWASPAIYICLFHGGWWVLLAHYIVSISISLIFGITNPKLAPTEEFFINFFKIALYGVYFLI